ncbi:TM2 domain-containing protein 2 [Hyalella azteca]|uniref:TM2 domain-containing protein 2 n=1 Tax=Hyalella azteca TaxID=294128 RepID=A0A8B7PMM5_HYAAZ|nr:TM2 domain-containing protein 2 [Hyalella azteca]
MTLIDWFVLSVCMTKMDFYVNHVSSYCKNYYCFFFFFICRPESFLECDPPLDLKGNKTEQEVKGYGCSKFGGWRFEDVEHTAVTCRVLEGIECCGSRSFLRHGKPCVKYSGHHFTTTLIYSLLLGFLGLDRFCLGLTGTAVGKLLTLGGFGVWWVVDIVLLVTGSLTPEDGSNWNTNV